MSPRTSVLVVGGGVFGLSGALELRQRGHTVTLVDPGPIPHPRASSTDISKIVRMDYGADDFMTAFAEAALQGWKAWNLATERPLYHPDGLLVLAGDTMDGDGFEHQSFRRLAARGLPLERLDPLTLATRFPEWNAELFPDGYFNPEAGWTESAAVVAWLRHRAERAGVRLVRERASGLLEASGRVRGVQLESGRVRVAKTTLIAAGAWTPHLVPGIDGLLQAVGQPVLHFGVDEPGRWSGPAFPVWAADISLTGWYGFPATREGRVKIGHHGPGMPWDPRNEAPFPAGHVERCRAFLRSALPALSDAPVVGRRVCFYCDTLDGRFWIDRHPDLDGLAVAAGGSGHGFKFAPLLGPVIADAVEGRTGRWGRPFRWRARRAGSGTTEAARYTGS